MGQGPGVFVEGWWRAEEPKPRGSLQGVLASLAYQRYKAGVDDFIQNYVDPTLDPSTAYASYPGAPVDSYQQPPFTQNAETTEGYQPPPVYTELRPGMVRGGGRAPGGPPLFPDSSPEAGLPELPAPLDPPGACRS